MIRLFSDIFDYFYPRVRVAGKLTGQGNETKPFTHVKRKKKKYGERKLSKKEKEDKL